MWASLVVLACFASAAAAGTRQLPFQSLRPDIMRAFIKKSGPSVPKGILAITLRDKCDECEAQAYNLHLLFSSFEDEPDVLSMGTVNVETQVEFAKVIGVTTDHPVPSLYLARPGEAPQRYTGSWDQLAVVKWVDTQLSTNVTATHVVPLSLATFNQRVSLPRQHSVIEFYAPWCGVCKTLTPPFEKAARALRYEKSVLFGKVNAAQEKELSSRFKVTYYPTFLYFNGTSGPSEVDFVAAPQLLDFMNQKAGTYRDMDGNLNARAGRIPEFDAVVRGFSTLDVTVQVDVLEDVRARRESLNHINQADALVYFDFMKGAIEANDDGKWISGQIEVLNQQLATTEAGSALQNSFVKQLNVLHVLSNTQSLRTKSSVTEL